jgi:hypothetical protein
MVKVMRRKIAMVALLGGLAAGLGCHHVGGKFDCGYNPADYPIGPPTVPYPTAPAPNVPPPKDKGSDTTPKGKTDGSDKLESGVPIIESNN